MRLFVIGATGRTGVELLDLAIARRHHVTAFVRAPHKIVRRDERLAVVPGNIFDAEQMARAMAGHDAVVSVLGPRPRDAILRGTTLMQASTASALAAMKSAGVTRFFVVSSALLFPAGGLLARFFRFLIRYHIRDLRATERLIEASATDWTIARPPRLVTARDDRYRAEEGGLPAGATLTGVVLSWRAVAAFLLDSAEKRLHSRKVVGICA